jgi:hypothetical protein
MRVTGESTGGSPTPQSGRICVGMRAEFSICIVFQTHAHALSCHYTGASKRARTFTERRFAPKGSFYGRGGTGASLLR